MAAPDAARAAGDQGAAVRPVRSCQRSWPPLDHPRAPGECPPPKAASTTFIIPGSSIPPLTRVAIAMGSVAADVLP